MTSMNPATLNRTTQHSALTARRLLESLALAWFATTPLASFYLRFPVERSLVTFDRAVFLVAALALLPRPGRVAATRFEIAWAMLAIVALLSALAASNNPGYSTKIAVDSFCLPLVAFHLARRHVDLRDHKGALLLAAIALALFLFLTGAYEFATGTNLFPYKGSELMREGERRVNGPFASDSSYAIICLLLALFLRLLPRLLGVRLDRAARLLAAVAVAAAIVASLLPLFRSVAAALILCWGLIELGLRSKDEGGRQTTGAEAEAKRPGRSFRPSSILLHPLVIALLVATVLLGSAEFGRRLSDPRNAYGRLATWQAAVSIALEYPAFGVGLTNYTDYFRERHDFETGRVESILDARAADSPHSNLLWIAAELGGVGLALYAAANLFIFLMGYGLLKRARGGQQRAAALCYLALAVAYSVAGLTLASGYYSDLNLYFFFMLGLLSNRTLTADS
jgi:hypothetical protein